MVTDSPSADEVDLPQCKKAKTSSAFSDLCKDVKLLPFNFSDVCENIA